MQWMTRLHYTLDYIFIYNDCLCLLSWGNKIIWSVIWVLWDYIRWGNLSPMNCMKSFSYACSIHIICLWCPWNNDKGIHDTCILFSSCVQGASLDKSLRCKSRKVFKAPINSKGIFKGLGFNFSSLWFP